MNSVLQGSLRWGLRVKRNSFRSKTEPAPRSSVERNSFRSLHCERSGRAVQKSADCCSNRSHAFTSPVPLPVQPGSGFVMPFTVFCSTNCDPRWPPFVQPHAPTWSDSAKLRAGLRGLRLCAAGARAFAGAKADNDRSPARARDRSASLVGLGGLRRKYGGTHFVSLVFAILYIVNNLPAKRTRGPLRNEPETPQASRRVKYAGLARSKVDLDSMRAARPFGALLMRRLFPRYSASPVIPAAERRNLKAWLVRARTGRGDIVGALTSARGPTDVAPVRGLRCARVGAPADSWGSRPRLYDGAPIRGLEFEQPSTKSGSMLGRIKPKFSPRQPRTPSGRRESRIAATLDPAQDRTGCPGCKDSRRYSRRAPRGDLRVYGDCPCDRPIKCRHNRQNRPSVPVQPPRTKEGKEAPEASIAEL
jgi:hypothetical protein